MTEPRENAMLVIDLIGLLAESMILSAVNQQDHILLRATRNVVQLHSLVIEHRAIGVADFNQ